MAGFAPRLTRQPWWVTAGVALGLGLAAGAYLPGHASAAAPGPQRPVYAAIPVSYVQPAVVIDRHGIGGPELVLRHVTPTRPGRQLAAAALHHSTPVRPTAAAPLTHKRPPKPAPHVTPGVWVPHLAPAPPTYRTVFKVPAVIGVPGGETVTIVPLP